MRAIVNGQVQRVNTCTTISISICIRTGAGSSIGFTSTVCPGEAFTYRGVEHIVRAVVDGQVQGIHTCTATIVGVRVSIGARSGVGLTRAVCPGEAFAYRGVEHIVSAVVDGQVQGIHTCTATVVGVRVSISTGSGIGLASTTCPGIAFAYRGVKHIVRAVVDGQV